MTTDPSSPDASLVEEVVLRFEQAWQRGDKPDPAAFIGPGADVHLIIELVHVDLERRLKLGESVSVEGYLQRFPVLAENPELLKALRAAEERLGLPSGRSAGRSSSTPTTSASLLQRLRQRVNQEDWRRFVRLYTPLLHHWACRTGFHTEEADDLVQEVFAQLVRELPDFHYDPRRSFRGWLHTVAVNKWNELRRRRRVLAQQLDHVDCVDEQAADPAALLAGDEFTALVYQRALHIMQADFPGNTWRACVAVVVDGKSAQEVARELGMTVGAVHAARFRVLARLRQELAGLAD